MIRSFCIVAALSLAAAGALAQAPAISVTPARLDFGTMKAHEVRQQDVVVKNTGNGVLKIQEVETTCGCTVAEVTDKELGPGEATKLAVEFNSKDYQGKQTKHITIFSNDPTYGAFDLVVNADIKVPLYCDSQFKNVGFEITKAGQTNTKVWNYWTEDVPALQMKVESKPEWVDVAIVNGVGGDKQKSKVTFTLRGDTKPGRHRGSITLSTNVPGEPTVVLDTATTVTYELTLGTDRVAFNYVVPEQPLSTRVRVGAADPATRFKLTRAEIDIPGLQARVENTVVGQEGQVIIEGKALPADNPLVQKANGRIKGTVKIYTDLPSTPVMELEVSYMIRTTS